MANISIYGSHNSAIAVEQDGKIVTVIEVERFVGYKNGGLAQYKLVKFETINCIKQTIEDILNFIQKNYGIDTYDTCFFMNTDVIMDGVLHKVHKFIPAKEYKSFRHHASHAAGSFYQSPYKEAIAFSFDGGGDDGDFNVFHCKRGEEPVLLEHVCNPIKSDADHFVEYDLGFAYMSFGELLGDIKYEVLSDGNLVYPGKIMGLASYGKVRQEWYQPIMDYYKSDPQGPTYIAKFNLLGKRLGFDNLYSGSNSGCVNIRFTEQIAYDLAATSQRVFEDCFLDVAKSYFYKYPSLPVIITGGCGLNIILNTRVKEEFKKDVFVGPIPNDCGLAVGMLLNHIKPLEPIDITYAGLPLLDPDMFNHYYQDNPWTKQELKIDDLVRDLVNNEIIGVVRGNAEHGARALGNRSIICSPFGKQMKDALNEKVKHREWYRPFAPVVRLEDVSKYFEWEGESRWMSFCPKVKEEWREKLGAITHIDNTARVQTVTETQNKWLYDLLTAFEKQTGVGVLLNTSFNVNGKPILSSLKEAFKVFSDSRMDGLVINDRYITKSNRLPK
jgi:carbamoyltransferase